MMKKLLILYLGFGWLQSSYAQGPIDTTATFNIGGIKQYVAVKGVDRQKPLLLFLTGGPGESSIGHSDIFTEKLRQHFILVEWDQRNCGKTMELNPSPIPVTLALCKQDAREMAHTLLQKFKRQKLYVLGWSWGTVLGFDLAKEMPGQIEAYFAVSPVVNQLASERLMLDKMKAIAKRTNNQQALADLAVVRIPPQNPEQLFLDRKWMFTLINGSSMDDGELKKVFFDPQMKWMFPLSNAAWSQNLTKALPELKCPVYFFIGKLDEQTNHRLGEQYFRELKAPKKQLFLFEKSAHAIPYMEPELFQEDLLKAAGFIK